MITVGDVMNMRAFDSIWLATPCDGAAAREVTGVGTLDHEPFTGGYEVFTQPNDIVIGSVPPFPARIAFCHGPVGEEIEFFQEK